MTVCALNPPKVITGRLSVPYCQIKRDLGLHPNRHRGLKKLIKKNKEVNLETVR